MLDKRDGDACHTQAASAMPTRGCEHAIDRIIAEIVDGLRHGYFEFSLTCEVIGQGRRRLILHAGKTYQFVIPQVDCERTNKGEVIDSRNGSDHGDV